jgi:prolyl oligopeptidase
VIAPGSNVADPRPLEDEVGGVRFQDPYRPLEQDSPEVLEWQRSLDATATARLQGSPGYARLRALIEPRIAAHFVFAPQQRGDRWFRLAQTPAGFGIVAADEPLGEGRVVLVPDGMALDWWFPSPEGRYVAYGLSRGGDEQSVVHVADAGTGEVLPDEIPFASFAGLAWLPDETGFYVSAGKAPDTEVAQKYIWFHRLGDRPPAEPEDVPAREIFVFPQISPDGRWVVQHASEIETRPDQLLDRETGEWRPFLLDRPGVFIGQFVGDEYVAITSDGASNGRIVAIPLDAGDRPERWRELVAESEAVLRDVQVVARRLVVSALVDAHSRITVHELDGGLLAEVPLPGLGATGEHSLSWGNAISSPLVSTASDSFTFVFSNHTRSGAVYRYFVESGELVQLTEPAFDFSAEVVTERLEAISSDGRPVRMWVVHRRDADRARPRPTLLYGYGGWNIAFVPTFYGPLTALLDAGGVLVFANLRGGGELGWEGWQQGRLHEKQRTFDDLYAAAEHLIASGITARDRLAVAGASNGGLLAAAAVTQRPDLWRAVVVLVPLTDMLRYKIDDFSVQCVEEYGDPDDPADAPVLRAYSPVHNIRDGASYPSTLIVCGGDDIRCPPWHGRKLTAGLLHANGGERPILFRVWPGAPHMAAVLGEAGWTAEWLGFVMDETGLA